MSSTRRSPPRSCGLPCSGIRAPCSGVLGNRAMRYLGSISYSIFLLHLLVLNAVMHVFGYHLFSGSTLRCSSRPSRSPWRWLRSAIDGWSNRRCGCVGWCPAGVRASSAPPRSERSARGGCSDRDQAHQLHARAVRDVVRRTEPAERQRGAGHQGRAGSHCRDHCAACPPAGDQARQRHRQPEHAEPAQQAADAAGKSAGDDPRRGARPSRPWRHERTPGPRPGRPQQQHDQHQDGGSATDQAE